MSLFHSLSASSLCIHLLTAYSLSHCISTFSLHIHLFHCVFTFSLRNYLFTAYPLIFSVYPLSHGVYTFSLRFRLFTAYQLSNCISTFSLHIHSHFFPFVSTFFTVSLFSAYTIFYYLSLFLLTLVNMFT